VAKGARRPRSRFGAALEPMTEGPARVFREGTAAELVGLNYAETVKSPLTLALQAPPEGGLYRGASPDVLGHIGYFAELLDEWAQEADADERLYRLGASMLDALSAGAPVEPLARYFEYWLLRLQGVYPEARGTAVGRGDGVSHRIAQRRRRSRSAACPRAAQGVEGARTGASRADYDAPGKDLEIGSRAS